MKDYYAILEISRDSSQEKIKEQYRFLLHAWHPDKFPDPKQKEKAQVKTQELNEAYHVLGDPFRRGQYDKEYFNSEDASLNDQETNHVYSSVQPEKSRQEKTRNIIPARKRYLAIFLVIPLLCIGVFASFLLLNFQRDIYLFLNTSTSSVAPTIYTPTLNMTYAAETAKTYNKSIWETAMPLKKLETVLNSCITTNGKTAISGTVKNQNGFGVSNLVIQGAVCGGKVICIQNSKIPGFVEMNITAPGGLIPTNKPQPTPLSYGFIELPYLPAGGSSDFSIEFNDKGLGGYCFLEVVGYK